MKTQESENTPTAETEDEDEEDDEDVSLSKEGDELAHLAHVPPSEFSMEPKRSPGEGESPLEASADRSTAGEVGDVEEWEITR